MIWPEYRRPKTEIELREILRENLSKILGSNVVTMALKQPSSMMYQDIIANRHLYERLGIAFAALGALKGYTDLPNGYQKVP